MESGCAAHTCADGLCHPGGTYSTTGDFSRISSRRVAISDSADACALAGTKPRMQWLSTFAMITYKPSCTVVIRNFLPHRSNTQRSPVRRSPT